MAGVALAQDDPPARAARLNYINGQVSFQAAGADNWEAAQLNRPLITGDLGPTGVFLEAQSEGECPRPGHMP